MGGGPAQIYPKANRTAQWWETKYSRGSFSRIEKVLLHTTETTSWPGYASGASAPTLTYHPRQRAWRQHNYLGTSARALVDPSGTAVRENRDNVIQIEIVCYSDAKLAATVGGLPVSQLSDAHYRDLAEFIAFIRKEWGGPPLAFPPRSNPRMTGPQYDAFKGLLGHDDASGNTHWDPGSFSFPKLIALVKEIEGTASAPTPAPAPVPEEDDMPYTPEQLAKAVWTDKSSDVIKAPAANLKTDPENTHWTPSSYLYYTYASLQDARAQLVGLSAAVKALAESHNADGAAVVEAVRSEVAKAMQGLEVTLSTQPAPEG